MQGLKKSVAYILCFFFSFQASLTPVGSAQAAEVPQAVQNVIVEEQEGAVFVTWNETVDPNGDVVGYKVYYAQSSVNEEGEIYDESVYTPASEPFYVFEDLEPGKDYYFAVTAIDNDGNESESYSDEKKISFGGTPEMLEAASFSVVKAVHINPTQIEIEMSDNVVVQSYYNAFIIENVNTGDEMFVGSISTKGEFVYLTISDDRFVAGESFLVTASSSVVNQQGDPVNSGITDSAEFTSLDFTEGPVETETLPETQEPTFDPVEIDDPIDYDSIYDQEYVEEALNPTIMEEEIFDPFAGPELEETMTDAELEADMIESQDREAPNDVSGLNFDNSLLPSDQVILLFWNPNTTDNDVVKQKIYIQHEGSFEREVKEVEGDTASYRLPVEEDKSYIVGIVAVDDSGNESSGVSVTFGTYLNRVGAATDFLAYLLVLCAGAYVVWRRKRA